MVRQVQLGSAGALRLLERGPGPALLIFGDLVTDLDFGALYDLHRARGSAVTLTSHWEGMRLRLGELTVEGDRVTDYQEKPEKRYLICSGVALFEQPALDCIPDQGMVGLVDAVRAAIHAGLPVGHWTHGAAWMEANERFGASSRKATSITSTSSGASLSLLSPWLQPRRFSTRSPRPTR